ncbi:AF4/FMR2 family member 1 isoform X2 [Triplophysa rosa]|uniref:AF4/FMR2 family member 1 isoform X2 n=1 Tax=Triplophysa rosa TaxID=992332 RepID=UPI002545BDCF|nr:AF4/FMR2 family member 1 isoform X2 [Triplophysa rosa]
MEDRNVLRRMERERRNQEVQQQEETRYDRIAPLFSEPYKMNKSDELSSRIQMMLGNFEDGSDVGLRELGSLFPFSDSTQPSHLQNSWGRTDGSTAAREASVQQSENLPLLSPPAEPLSPLQPSDVDDPSPEARRADPSQMEAPPLALTLPLNLHHKPGLLNPKKPTAYVRPMDGQDQMTSGSPDLKTSPETYEHLLDPKNSGSPKRPLERPPQSVDIGRHEAQRVDNILKEMTSWPELLTNIHTPSTREPLLSTERILNCRTPFQITSEYQTDQIRCLWDGFKALAARQTAVTLTWFHSADGLVQSDSCVRACVRACVCRGGSSISSDSDSSSSDSEIISAHVTSRTPHTQNPESLCHDIRPDSHDSPGRTEAEDQQSRSRNPTHADTEANHAQTVKSTRALDSTCLENSQHNKNTSTCRAKENGKKTDERRARDPSVCSTKHTDQEFTWRPLLVKIELKLLSRIPQEPGTATERPDPQKIPRHKRPAERDGTSQMKKRRTDKEERRSFSSQNTTSQSEVTKSCSSMKKRKQQKPIPPDSQQQKAEAHGKKTYKSHDVPATKPRTLLRLDHRQRSVEDHMREAKKLKHKADATMDKMSKALSYLEAALSFVESGVAMESDTQMPRSAYTMFSETLELISLRCESMLQMTMFRYRRDSALKHSRTLAEHFKNTSCSASPVSSSGTVVIPQPIQQVAASYVEVTALFLNALERWEQADEVALGGSGLLRELDRVVAPLSLTSSMSSLVQYARHGLHWIRLEP